MSDDLKDKIQRKINLKMQKMQEKLCVYNSEY